MASGKRQPSKQKRTNQNRQERAARQARAAAAKAAPPAKGGGGSGSASKGSLLGRLRGAAPARPAAPAKPSAAAQPAASGGGGNANRMISRSNVVGNPLTDPAARPPGYRAALTGVIAACAAVVASFFLHSAVDSQGDIYTKPAIVADWSETALHAALDAPDDDAAALTASIDDWMPERGSDRLFLIYWPLSLAAVLPIVGAALAFRAVGQRRPAKVVSRAMYATLLGAFLTLGLLQFFLPAVIAVSVAGYQVRKAEMAAFRAAAAEAGPADGGADDGVIEADVVEPGPDPED